MTSSQMKNLGVIILAAGASSRMGRPKLLLPWGNTTVISHLIEQWRELAAAQIAVVCRLNDEALDAELNRLHFPVTERILNPQPERGMFSSVLCAANWDGWHDGLTAWAIVLGDQPHLRQETLEKLLAFHRDHADAICQPVFDGRAQHPVLLPRPAFFELKDSSAKTLKDFLKQTSCPLAECSIQDPGLSLDMDTPEDYERVFKFHRGKL